MGESWGAIVCDPAETKSLFCKDVVDKKQSVQQKLGGFSGNMTNRLG